MSKTQSTLTYARYLQLESLLDLQKAQSNPAEHDEMLFIIIHQTYELWFKQALHELDKAKSHLSKNELYGALGTFKRVRMILKTLVGQIDILETMTPVSFQSFRDRLDTASGFQSMQFRELEFVLGAKRPEVSKYIKPSMLGYEAVMRRLGEPSLIDHFHIFLKANEAQIPQSVLDREVTEPNSPNEQVQGELIRLYRARPDLALLFELMTDIDEGLQEWRYRHIKLAERTIGQKQGTGGSPGIEFLKRSLFTPVFPDLWQIRNQL